MGLHTELTVLASFCTRHTVFRVRIFQFTCILKETIFFFVNPDNERPICGSTQQGSWKHTLYKSKKQQDMQQFTFSLLLL